MKGFKLLSIQPLEGCDPKFLKVLKPGVEYKFYSTAHSEIDGIYKAGKTNVNISAIVGKNGAGKSSILELFYKTIFFLYQEENRESKAFKIKIKYYLNGKIHVLKFSDSKNYSLIEEQSGKKIPRTKKEDIISFYSIAINYSLHGLNTFEYGYDWLNHLLPKNDSYTIPLVITPYRNDGIIDINRESELTQENFLSNLLTQDSVNNGNHVTNNLHAISLSLGINESKLKYFINKKDKDHFIEFKTKILRENLDINYISYDDDDLLINQILNKYQELIIKELYSHYKIVKEKPLDKRFKFPIDVISLIKNYIVIKLIKISKLDKYKSYSFINEDEIRNYWITKEKKELTEQDIDKIINTEKLKKFISKIINDKSHTTLKLRRAINYIKYIKELSKCYLIPQNNSVRIDLTIPEFSRQIDLIKSKVPELSLRELLPPSIFNVDIFLLTKENYDLVNNKKHTEKFSFLSKLAIPFGHLSSGEQQLIHSIQGIIYHIRNLESVFMSNNTNRSTYENINIILDEIELYFHPDYQRKFISRLLDAIENLDLKFIKNINILFSTHSPFILSDIPKSNVLLLDNGQPVPVKVETFASNIHDILKSGFFLDANTGEYSIKLINSVLDQINRIKDLKRVKGNSQNRIRRTKELEDSNSLQIINTIGDSIVRRKLKEMYYECFLTPQKARKEVIQDEINYLQNELKNFNHD